MSSAAVSSTDSSSSSSVGSPVMFPRRDFLETMEISRSPDDSGSSDGQLQRFISRQPAWQPAGELPLAKLGDKPWADSFKPAAYGGWVFAQAPLAAARAVEEEDEKACNGVTRRKFGIHSIQGVFSNVGRIDRPFIYDVSKIASSRSFSTSLVKVRQPTQPSVNPSGPYPLSDSSLPLGDVCFTCLTTFKRPVPSPTDQQIPISAQERYASILSLKAPHEWEASPQADIDIIKDAFPNAGPGAFPVLDMRKVDMTSFNTDKPATERRELSLYRLLKPLSTEDANAHILCHAFEADRNGLVMLGNHLGWGYNLGSVATLSCSFYVHVNADEAVMQGDGWWLQEISWPRVSAGRGMMESRIWSPEGKHVASGYQDGLLMPNMKKTGCRM